MVNLDNYINEVKHLPPAPEVLPDLLHLLDQPNIDSGRIVRLITYDPGLTASVLHLCNSASVASGTPATCLEEAVVRLGFSQVYRLVASVIGAQILKTRDKAQERGLWRHSVVTAVAAQIIAHELGTDGNLIFTAALLHDIGKIIMAEVFEDRYWKLIEEVESNQYSLLEAEKRVLGVQHTELGGRLLARWKFPLSLVTAVCFHHHPKAGQPYERIAAHVYLGNLMAYLMGYGFGHQPVALRGRAEALEILHLDGECLPRYMLAAYGQFAEIQSFFQIGS
jgi:putative nucleotidyltransferase with HDIG domain